jgi:hypothetical protein
LDLFNDCYPLSLHAPAPIEALSTSASAVLKITHSCRTRTIDRMLGCSYVALIVVLSLFAVLLSGAVLIQLRRRCLVRRNESNPWGCIMHRHSVGDPALSGQANEWGGMGHVSLNGG